MRGPTDVEAGELPAALMIIRPSMQGEKLGPPSRHQAAAVGSTVYIHNHRSTSTIMALDTLASPPKLTSIPVSTTGGYPASRSSPH